MSRSLADALEKLLVAGGRLAASQLTAAQRGALEEFARRTLAVRLSVSGRGSLYQIAAPEQVQAHLAQLRPGHTENAASVIPQRALNMSRYRDSKVVVRGTRYSTCCSKPSTAGSTGVMARANYSMYRS